MMNSPIFHKGKKAELLSRRQKRGKGKKDKKINGIKNLIPKKHAMVEGKKKRMKKINLKISPKKKKKKKGRVPKQFAILIHNAGKLHGHGVLEISTRNSPKI